MVSLTLKVIPVTLIIMIVGALLIMAALPLIVSIFEALPLPLSEHAKSAHAGQAWDAEKIQNHMLTRKCTPHEYMCANSDKDILWCEAQQGIPALGLIIGRTTRQIITGFAGSNNYWEKQCRK